VLVIRIGRVYRYYFHAVGPYKKSGRKLGYGTEKVVLEKMNRVTNFVNSFGISRAMKLPKRV